MDLTLFPSEDLLAELIRRDAVKILQTTQRIDGIEFVARLGEADDVRAEAIAMCQRMSARVISGDFSVQHVTQRKLKTSASEEIQVTLILATSELMRRLVSPPNAKEPADEH
jgi:acetate kinase